MKGAATHGLAKLGEWASAGRSHSRSFLATESRSEDSNTDAYAGLGAEFGRGNYRAELRDFQTTVQLAPDDQATGRRLDVCNELLMLDPTMTGLSPAERFSRRLELVELTADDPLCRPNVFFAIELSPAPAFLPKDQCRIPCLPVQPASPIAPGNVRFRSRSQGRVPPGARASLSTPI